MKKLCILLALLCLAGCTPKHIQPSNDDQLEQPTDKSAFHMLYAYENGARNLAVNEAGHVVLEVYDGQLSIVQQDSQSVGIGVMRTDGSVTDEWGWKSPEHYRTDIYDVTGRFRFSVPLSYVSLEGDFLTGYNPNAGSTQIYSWADGELLYDQVQTHFPIGNSYFVQLQSENLLLHKDGTVTALPEEYTVRYNISDQLMAVEKNGLQGLMDESGNLVLPCAYTWLTTSDHNYIFVQDESTSDHLVIDPKTGETVFRWPYNISSMPTKDCAVVAVDDDYSAYQLVDLSGTPILSQRFGWISHYFVSEESDPILHGTTEDPQGSVLFQPDGTILYTASGYGYCNVIDEETVLICQYGDTSTDWLLMNLKDDSTKPLSHSPDSYYSQLYGTQGPEHYLLRGYTNEQGWYRHDVLDTNGNILLSNLQDCAYLGNGIFQCRLGFRSGLLRLDGTWLYQEGTFSAMDDG